MKKTLLVLAISLSLSGCALIQSTGLNETDPTSTTQMKGVKKEFDTIRPPAVGKPVSVAVYSFQDKTGQRKPQANVASLSSAVTQGGETFLIQALQNVGRGQWFDVVERVGIDNLTKERLIIRQMREAYEGNNAKPLMPMQFAGLILEGGIIGYDSSTTSGGAGMRILGIGKQTQWSTDVVTISLRAVSVNTGKVLATITVQKTILSTADSATALKFYDTGTKSFEAEAGITINEPGTYAVKAAIEMAVVELIKEGQRKGLWDFKPEHTSDTPNAITVEEKKNELVQTPSPRETTSKATPASPKPEIGRRDESSERESKPAEQERLAPQVVKESNEILNAGQKKYKNTQRITVRKEPNQESKVVEILALNQTVTILDNRYGWVLLSVNGKVLGWSWKPLLKEERDSN